MIDEGALIRADESTWIFGHAIYEHAYAGALDVRGLPIDLDLDLGNLALADARARIDQLLAAADFAHVARRGPGIALLCAPEESWR